jgi:hypothetical protein
MPALAKSVAPALLLLMALLAACSPAGNDCDAPTLSFDLTITAREMEPSDLVTCRGNEITITVTADEHGVFHLHGYDEEAPATELNPGVTETIVFTAVRSGQFIIEFHAGDGEAVDLGVLTVNEP